MLLIFWGNKCIFHDVDSILQMRDASCSSKICRCNEVSENVSNVRNTVINHFLEEPYSCNELMQPEELVKFKTDVCISLPYRDRGLTNSLHSYLQK
jgi:hypothetical protein